LSIFPKSDEKIQTSLRSDKNNGNFTRKPTHIYDNISLNCCLEWEIFQKKFVEKIKTHFLRSRTFSWKSCCLWDKVEKCGTARQATENNTIWCRKDAIWTPNN